MSKQKEREEKKNELLKRILLAENYKHEIQKQLQDSGGLVEWTNYYDNYIKLCKQALYFYQSQEKLERLRLIAIKIPLFILAILIIAYILYLIKQPIFLAPTEPGGIIELRPQLCALQNQQANQNIFNLACAGNYPNSNCANNSDRLSCDDAYIEIASNSKSGPTRTYGGIRISSFNDSITDCKLITEVFLCYKFWTSGNTGQHLCTLGIDTNGGASWSDIPVSCAGAEPASISCINVTSTENWQCQNFFRALGVGENRSLAKAQAQRLGGNGIDQWAFDVLFFNVTYDISQDTDPPLVAIIDPKNIAYNTFPISFNISTNENSTAYYSLDGGINNISMMANASATGFTSFNDSIADGIHTVNYYVFDVNNNINDTESIVFSIDTTFPLISYGIETADNGTTFSQSNIYVNVTFTEINFANITFLLFNNTSIINSTTYTTAIYKINWTNLNAGNYSYNVSIYDTAGNFNSTDTRLINLIQAINQPPIIIDISDIPPQSVTEAGTTSVIFNILASDSDVNDLNDATIYAEFSRAGEDKRIASCFLDSDIDATIANYSCSIEIWYWDAAGIWNVTASILDLENHQSDYYNESFMLLESTCMVMAPTALTWNVLFPAETDKLSTNDPIIINNTCNSNIASGGIKIIATNLLGEQDSSYALPAANFTVHTSDICNIGTILANGTSIPIIGASLPAGNNSLNYNNETSGQEELYFCIEHIPADLFSQLYSTLVGGAWEITLLITAFTIKRRKRNKNLQEILYKKLKKNYKIDLEKLSLLDNKFRASYGIGIKELLTIARKRKIKENIPIPIEIFKQKIAPAESLCKYLKENKSFKYSEIASILNRNQRTIWITYRNAVKKKKEKIKVSSRTMYISIKVFSDRKLSILESLIYYLRQKGFKNSEIAKMLNKDPRNVWTLYSRALKKLS